MYLLLSHNCNELHPICWRHWLLHISIRPARLVGVPFADYIPEEVKLPWLSDLLGKDKSRENQRPRTLEVHIGMWAKVGRVIRSQRPSPPTQPIDSQRPSPPTQPIDSKRPSPPTQPIDSQRPSPPTQPIDKSTTFTTHPNDKQGVNMFFIGYEKKA